MLVVQDEGELAAVIAHVLDRSKFAVDVAATACAFRSHAIDAPIPTGAQPKGVAVGEGAVWVANAGTCTISRVAP